jgi:hypothetical protein
MAGYGSPPPEDRGNHPGRRVARPNPVTGSQSIWSPEQAEALRGAIRHVGRNPYYEQRGIQPRETTRVQRPTPTGYGERRRQAALREGISTSDS